jgi:Mn-dependent DtxR family transcriptional regulator
MRTLRFVYDYIKSNDYAPTSKEIGEALGISSTTAYERTHYLFGHGYLTRPETGKWGRDIALTEKGVSVCESFSEERQLKEQKANQQKNEKPSTAVL